MVVVLQDDLNPQRPELEGMGLAGLDSCGYYRLPVRVGAYRPHFGGQSADYNQNVFSFGFVTGWRTRLT